MSESNWDERAVFLEALALPKDQRNGYLDSACPDASARARIETLLHHHDVASDDFLKISVKPVVEHSSQPVQIDEFKILHRLGAGGMGVVYLAEDTILGRHVALKVLARHMIGSEQALARFREEARSAAALKHPAIVPVFKSGRDGDDYYLVSEFVEGRTLAELINEMRTTLTSAGTSDLRTWHRRAAEIVAIVADALDCAHRAKIVHRDVKPSNILIDKDRGPRLTDFGIAKHLVEENRTRETGLVGSCHYMSPEQADIAEKQVDQRSDIFSLGVVLYEMLALRLPFDGINLHQVLKAVVECNPPKLRTIDRNIPADLETICHKALEKLPRDRYQTAAHIAADLRCYLAGDPILARPPSRTRRMKIWYRTHKRQSVVAVSFLLIAILAGLSWRLYTVQSEASAWLTIQTDIPDCFAYLRKVDETTLELETNRREIRKNSFASQQVLPGLYRITVVDSNSKSFSEFDTWLESGRNHKTILRVTTKNTSDLASAASLGKSVSGSSPSAVQTLTARMLPEADVVKREMTFISGGEFDFGRTKDDLDPLVRQRRVKLPAFYIDKYEVSNRQYKEFIDVTKYPMPGHWEKLGYDAKLADYPIVYISQEDANAYARWCGKRLPTVYEWEAAMRSPDGRRLPWKDGEQTENSMITIEGIARVQKGDIELSYPEYVRNARPVSSEPALATPLGLFHAATNVMELTSTISLSRSNAAVTKGASWIHATRYYDLTHCWAIPRGSVSITTGFRCARSASQ